MSFDATSFFLLTDSIGGKAKRVFAYLTNDTQDQIAAAGYFTGVGKKFGVQVGDLVIVASLANAYPTSTFYFSAVSPTTGNATAVGDLWLNAGAFPVSTAQAVASITVPAGALVVQTSGYSSAGDGGGATYVYSPSLPGHAGVVTDATGRHFVMFGTQVNVKSLGAKGDGVTDDTTAISHAYVVAGSIGAHVVEFPDAAFVCGPLTFSSYDDITIKGEQPNSGAMTGSRIIARDATADVWTIGPVANVRVDGIGFTYGASAAGVCRTSGAYLKFTGCNSSGTRNVNMLFGYDGIVTDATCGLMDFQGRTDIRNFNGRGLFIGGFDHVFDYVIMDMDTNDYTPIAGIYSELNQGDIKIKYANILHTHICVWINPGAGQNVSWPEFDTLIVDTPDFVNYITGYISGTTLTATAGGSNIANIRVGQKVNIDAQHGGSGSVTSGTVITAIIDATHFTVNHSQTVGSSGSPTELAVWGAVTSYGADGYGLRVSPHDGGIAEGAAITNLWVGTCPIGVSFVGDGSSKLTSWMIANFKVLNCFGKAAEFDYCDHISIVNPAVVGNSQTVFGTASAIKLNAHVDSISFSGGFIGGDAENYGETQAFGIEFDPSFAGIITMNGVDLRGNTIAPIYPVRAAFADTGAAGSSITNCPGYNPGGISPQTVPASGDFVHQAGYGPETIYISGGTYTSALIKMLAGDTPLTVSSGSDFSVHLPPRAFLLIDSLSAAPTMEVCFE